ncbi:MAG TPA: GNAT family N-acetyltransferase [Jatrophihabitans sp.]|jgi:predicted acetyltransferase
MSPLVLRPYRIEDETEALAAQDELALDDFQFLLFRDDSSSWQQYVRRLELDRYGIDLPPGRVRNAQLAAEADGVLVGRTSIRFQLDDWLRQFGGHIGYGVRPGYRRRGFATEILRQSLVIARAGGVGDVLICCHDANAGSAAVIEVAGGVLEGTVHDATGELIRRYWIAYPSGIGR